jgi:hypothetical protein
MVYTFVNLGPVLLREAEPVSGVVAQDRLDPVRPLGWRLGELDAAPGEHLVVARQSVVAMTPGERAPFATSARTCSAVCASSIECAGSMSTNSWLAVPGGRTVIQRMPLSSFLAPQPRLEDVPGLVDAARRAGTAVDLTMPADQSALPPGVGLAAYRIVQESLSNAGRHARLTRQADSVRNCGL